ncbi:hypothetical protein Z043_121051 [Scleropages formosus]|uniref:Uncharacterized protein n=1 Tax=Scleropages formosus TaxID=113540 RepID=A0A0P7WCR5_SCLFO|nr:hypothetical protein Z043_121051 [Scleropages formosus]
MFSRKRKDLSKTPSVSKKSASSSPASAGASTDRQRTKGLSLSTTVLTGDMITGKCCHCYSCLLGERCKDACVRGRREDGARTARGRREDGELRPRVPGRFDVPRGWQLLNGLVNVSHLVVLRLLWRSCYTSAA